MRAQHVGATGTQRPYWWDVVVLTNSRPEFTVSFEGPALAEANRMDVNDLAPALLALADVFHRANELTAPGAPRVNLEIRAFRPGSFEVWLSLGQAAQDVIRALDSPGTDAFLALVALIGYVTKGFGLVSRLRDQPIVKQEEMPGGETILTLGNGTTIVTDARVVVIAGDAGVRASMKKAVAPLARDGIDRLRIDSADAEEPVVIEAEDLPSYDALPLVLAEPITEHELSMTMQIVSIAFDDRYKSRLSDGERTYAVTIEDRGFSERIQSGAESFRKGDTLRCMVRIRQWQVDDRLRTEYAVVQVLDHDERQGVQLALPT